MHFQVRTSISWTVHLLPLLALYHLTVAFNAARDWAHYGAWSCAFFICWWHLPCCSSRGSSIFQVRTSISWTVHILPLFALYHLTISFDAARDWSTLQCVILRIFYLLISPSMLLVQRSEEFSSAHINIFDCTPSDILCALLSISLSNSMHPEFGTSCA